MKLSKNKIVFSSVIFLIVVFLVTYYFYILKSNHKETENIKQTNVPELKEDQKAYTSKLDAINDLKEVRPSNAPSIYDDKLLDSLGYYDSDLPDLKKEKMIDSIYALGASRNAILSRYKPTVASPVSKNSTEADLMELRSVRKIAASDMGVEHQLFFASNPKGITSSIHGANRDTEITVVVDGTQVVKANSRLKMRLTHPVTIDQKVVPKNTPLYGFISFQPNRVLVEIQTIDNREAHLKAFDLQDGSEGIYIEHNFRAEATTQVIDELIDEINVPGAPQVTGVTKILKRNNRNVKATILNNYKLILKQSL